jgi:hypothetical protein
MDLTVKCDRCGKITVCWQDDIYTSGFYRVSTEYYRKFRKHEKEEVVCDECMKADLECLTNSP